MELILNLYSYESRKEEKREENANGRHSKRLPDNNCSNKDPLSISSLCLLLLLC